MLLRRSFSLLLSALPALAGRIPLETRQSAASSSSAKDTTTNVTESVIVAVPVDAPVWAEQLSPDLVSFSIENDRWPDWVGGSASGRNNFTTQALTSLAQLTGKPPHIRVGADSEDRTLIDPNLPTTDGPEVGLFPPSTVVTPFPEATNDTIRGSDFYALSAHLLPGTPMTWGLNLRSGNVTNAVDEARALLQAFSEGPVRDAGITLQHVEVGNEPDLFKDPLYVGDWTILDYTRNWTNFANSVDKAVPGSQFTWQVGAFADIDDTGANDKTAQGVWLAGIRNSEAGARISTFSQHHYFAAYCNGGAFNLADLLNKQYIRTNVSQLLPDLIATKRQSLDYILGETNSIACHGAPGVSDSGGSAVWGVDYILQSAALGVGRLHFHEGVGYKYNLFQPIPLNRSVTTGYDLSTPFPAHVNPLYYAALVVNTAIGKSGNARVAELDVSSKHVAGYGIWEGNKLARAVFLNSNGFFKNNTQGVPDTVRSASKLFFTFPSSAKSGSGSSAAKGYTVERLSIPYTDVTYDVPSTNGSTTSGNPSMTWAGQTWDYAAPVGQRTSEQATSLENGLQIEATEVVLVTFQY